MLPEHRRTAGAAPGRAVSAPFLRPSNSLDLSCLRGRMAPDVALGHVVQRSELAAHNGVVAGSNLAGPTTPHPCRLHRAGSNCPGPSVSDALRPPNSIRSPNSAGGEPLPPLSTPPEE